MLNFCKKQVQNIIILYFFQVGFAVYVGVQHVDVAEDTVAEVDTVAVEHLQVDMPAVVQ